VYDNFGEWVRDNSDVETPGMAPGLMPSDIDMTTMMGSPDCLDGGPPTSTYETDPATSSLMPDRMGPLTKDTQPSDS
jgi:hypothetical protein